MWTWKLETPWTVPAGARISAGYSGSVDRSLPNEALTDVKRSPVSCMPSPGVAGEAHDDSVDRRRRPVVERHVGGPHHQLPGIRP